jgi:hypothetical protein
VDFVAQVGETLREVPAGQVGLAEVVGGEFHEEFGAEAAEGLLGAGEEAGFGALDVDLDQVDLLDVILLHEIVEGQGGDAGAQGAGLVGEVGDGGEALVVGGVGGEGDVGFAGLVGEGDGVGVDDVAEAVAGDVLLEAVEDGGDGFEGVDLAGGADAGGHVEGDLAEVGADVEGGHAGLEEAFEGGVEVGVVGAEDEDVAVDVVVGGEVEVVAPLVAEPLEVGGGEGAAGEEIVDAAGAEAAEGSA